MVPRYRALLVGNSRFVLDATLPNLEGPVNDVVALRGALTNPEVGLFAPADVRVVPERGAQEILVEVQQFLDSATRDDLLLLYYSGHGVLDNRNHLFFCAADTRTDVLKATSVGGTVINSMIADSAARTTLIVLDCCHSGAFKGVALPASLAGTGRFVLTSCRGSELANDTDTRNGTSLFTTHLVEALTCGGSDPDGDGYVDLDELYDVVLRRLSELTPRRPLPQRDFAGVGDVAIARRPGSRSARTPPAGTPPVGTPPAGTRVRRAGWWRIPAAGGAAVVLAAAVIALVASGFLPVDPGCAPGDPIPLGSGLVAAVDQRCPGELAEGLAQPSTRAAREFSADGTAVEGAPAAVEAPWREPGTYRDTLLQDEASWYAVELEEGEELVATVTRAGLPDVQVGRYSLPPYLEVFFADPDFNEANTASRVGYRRENSAITAAHTVQIRTGVVGLDSKPPSNLLNDPLPPGIYAVRVLQERGYGVGAGDNYFSGREIPVELTFDVQRSEGGASPPHSPSPATEEPAVVGLLSGLVVLMAVSLTVLLRGVRRAAPGVGPAAGQGRPGGPQCLPPPS